MDKEIRINIQVGDLKHPLTLDMSEEPIYREAARLVNERVQKYATKYRGANLPHEYFMAFAALDIAGRLVRLSKEIDFSEEEKALDKLTGELQDFLQH